MVLPLVPAQLSLRRARVFGYPPVATTWNPPVARLSAMPSGAL
ncbi:MAG: hypothetical protein WCI12_03085 [Actinomycetes bacterium]